MSASRSSCRDRRRRHPPRERAGGPRRRLAPLGAGRRPRQGCEVLLRRTKNSAARWRASQDSKNDERPRRGLALQKCDERRRAAVAVEEPRRVLLVRFVRGAGRHHAAWRLSRRRAAAERGARRRRARGIRRRRAAPTTRASTTRVGLRAHSQAGRRERRRDADGVQVHLRARSRTTRRGPRAARATVAHEPMPKRVFRPRAFADSTSKIRAVSSIRARGGARSGAHAQTRR